MKEAWVGKRAQEKEQHHPAPHPSWLLQQAGVTTLIVGAKKLAQLEDTLAVS